MTVLFEAETGFLLKVDKLSQFLWQKVYQYPSSKSYSKQHLFLATCTSKSTSNIDHRRV